MDFLTRKPKLVLLAFVVALALAYLWRYRNADAVRGLIHSRDDRPLNIQFDNGTVRDTTPASAASGVSALRPPGGFRKCSNGKTTVYTDRVCPPGSKEMATQNGTLNVVAH